LWQTSASPESQVFLGIGIESGVLRFQIADTNGAFKFYASPTTSPVFTVSGGGALTAKSLYLGTASPLSYFEEYDHIVNYVGPLTPYPKLMKIVRVGRLVTVYNTAAHWGTTATSTFFANTPETAIPPRFRPASQYGVDDILATFIQVRVNNNFVQGMATIDGGGNIRIYAGTTVATGNFPLAGLNGFNRWSASWQL